MNKILTISLLSLLTACAVKPSNQSHAVQEAVPAMVQSCEFIGGVYGESAWSHLSIGNDSAKYQALDRAARIGATHVVWTDQQSGWRPYAAGRAYRCVY